MTESDANVAAGCAHKELLASMFTPTTAEDHNASILGSILVVLN